MSTSLVFSEIFHHLEAVLPRHWQRRRGTLGPLQILLSLMTMSVLGGKGYERTLEELKRYLAEVLGWQRDVRAPSGQALSQARRKLTPDLCRTAVKRVTAYCGTARAHAGLGYGGLRLLAIDGTKLTLPAYKKLRDHFGCPKQSPGGPQASMTMVWDVGANQPVDWLVGPYRVCERLHAQELVQPLGPNDLLMGDRNFPSRRLLTDLQDRGANWLMRVRSAGPGSFLEVLDFVASGLPEQLVSLVTSTKPGSPTFPSRLLRLDLHDGTVAVFITSLVDAVRHPRQALIDLYAARWRIENAFRELKIWHGLQHFHARYPDGIAQEIAALMLFQVMTSELEAQARVHLQTTIPVPEQDHQPAQVRSSTLRFNRRIVADCAVFLLNAAAQGEDALRKEFDDSLLRIWRSRQKAMPRRSFPRERKSSAPGWRGKPVAKNGGS